MTLDHLREIFHNGDKWLTRVEAVAALEELTDVKRPTACDSLKADGPYGDWLRENPANEKISIRKEREEE